MAAILNSILLSEKLWAAKGAIAGKFIVCTAFRINFYLVLCYPIRNTYEYRLNLLVVGAICETPKQKIIVKGYRATAFFIIISHLPPGHPIISSLFKMAAAVSVKRSSCRCERIYRHDVATKYLLENVASVNRPNNRIQNRQLLSFFQPGRQGTRQKG